MPADGHGGPGRRRRPPGVVGVMGFPVAHSLSPRLHNAAFAHLGIDWVSVGFPVAPGPGRGRRWPGPAALGIRGLSVTMPHKEDVGRRRRRVPSDARPGSARSTAWSAGEGGWRGENTDGAGFLAALARGDRFEPSGPRCLVVGAGGAARAVIAALGDAGASRGGGGQPDRGAGRGGRRAGRPGGPGRDGGGGVRLRPGGERHAGGHGGRGRRPGRRGRSTPALLGPAQVVVDLVYHPPVTPWLAAAAERGATHGQRARHARPPGRTADRAVDGPRGPGGRHVGGGAGPGRQPGPEARAPTVRGRPESARRAGSLCARSSLVTYYDRHPRDTLPPRVRQDRPDPAGHDRHPGPDRDRDDLLGHQGQAGPGRGTTRTTT